MLPRSVPGRRHAETRCLSMSSLSMSSLSMSVLAPQGSDPRRVFTTGWPCNERALERVRAERAARYAVDFMNAHHGSPLHSYDHGPLCSWKRNEDNKGADYQLECEVEEQPSKRKLKVTATVLFPPGRETPRVNITSELSPHEEAYDEAWEENLREYPGQSLGENIPDNFGHVPHNKTALLRLAQVAGSIINVENGGEHKTYDLQRINSVALSLLSRDSLRIFDYEVIAVEMPTQPPAWSRLLLHPRPLDSSFLHSSSSCSEHDLHTCGCGQSDVAIVGFCTTEHPSPETPRYREL
uniref:Cystatin LXN-type domain-containing protein n=1 Tax=Eptatretus burgeri TaxID=7764 RepID=A0A8C4QAN8_EPTBU